MWVIYALYEQVTGSVRCRGGLWEPIASTIGVKQGCPLSRTLFELYIDEIFDYILRAGGGGTDLSCTPIHIMLYGDDIVLILESEESLQQHLEELDEFCTHQGWTVILGKLKVMIFHTSHGVMRTRTFTATGGHIGVVQSYYVYLGVTFASRVVSFTMRQAATDRLTQGYAVLAMLEQRCHQTLSRVSHEEVLVWYTTLVSVEVCSSSMCTTTSRFYVGTSWETIDMYDLSLVSQQAISIATRFNKHFLILKNCVNNFKWHLSPR